MRGMLEYTMGELISTQVLIGETFDRMQHLINNNLDELRELRDIYAQKSIDALHLLWNYFNDNNHLLTEAQLKDDKYFTDKVYDKIKEEYLSVMPVLRQYAVAEFPAENSPSNLKFISQRDLHIHHQRLRFKTMHEEVKSINMDRVQDTKKMEAWQKILKQQWIIIEKCHKTIREIFPGKWPDLPYELDYVQYKNMYETTYSLFNYKIDAQLYPIVRVIPHIGIPTWRMFDNAADIHPFAANSVAWAHFDGLSDVMRNNKISEGERRQLLITTFLTYQNNFDDDDYEPLTPQDFNFDADTPQCSDDENQNAFEEPLLFPMVRQID